MPWSQTSPMDQKLQFVAECLREVFSISELCERFGISRKTGYKWIERYLRNGAAGLEDRSRRPRSAPNATAPQIVQALLVCRPVNSLTKSFQLCEDRIGGGGPHKWFAVLVVMRDEVFDLCREVLYRSERAAANCFVGNQCKEALDQI